MMNWEHWNDADQKLITKMLQEFMYEEIIAPKLLSETEGVQNYEWMDQKGTVYRFKAKPRLFDSYHVLPGSVEVLTPEPKNMPLSLSLLLSIQLEGKMSASTAGHLVKEYLNTLVADTHLKQNSKNLG